MCDKYTIVNKLYKRFAFILVTTIEFADTACPDHEGAREGVVDERPGGEGEEEEEAPEEVEPEVVVPLGRVVCDGTNTRDRRVHERMRGLLRREGTHHEHAEAVARNVHGRSGEPAVLQDS